MLFLALLTGDAAYVKETSNYSDLTAWSQIMAETFQTLLNRVANRFICSI